MKSDYQRRRTLLAILALLVASLWPMPGLAGSREDALAAIKRGDYEAAITLLRPLAENGDVEAQVFLGNLFEFGYGEPVDFVEASRWYRRAAQAGNILAQAKLGRMLAGLSDNETFNTGLPRDYPEALDWLTRSAERSNSIAQTALGIMYYGGRGVPRDYVQARMWNILAMRAGNYEAGLTDQNFSMAMTPEQTAQAERLAQDWLIAHQQK